MRKQDNYIYIWCAATFLFLASGCVKDKLHDEPFPEKGALAMTVDWTQRSSGVDIPAGHVVKAGDIMLVVSGMTDVFLSPLEPGAYPVLVYNEPEGMTVTGNEATVAELEDGTLEPLPGYLFSGAVTATIVAGDTTRVTVQARQLVRDVRFTMRLSATDAGRVARVTAVLSGVAGRVTIPRGEVLAGETGRKVRFVLSPAGKTGESVLVMGMRLVGVADDARQWLALELTLTDGSVHELAAELTAELSAFGQSATPLELETNLQLPVKAGVTATITGWKVVDNGTAEVK